jgi:drug/metabolite transporter (DMT)-like permease
LIAGRRARRELHLLAYTFRVYSIAGIILIILTLVFAFTGMQNNGLRLIELFADYPSNSFLWLVLLAIVPQIIGHTAFNWSLAYLPATFVSVALLGEPIGSTLLAMVFLSEAPTALQLFGAVLILSGIVISSRQNRIKK